MHQRTVEASTRWGVDTYLIAQQLDGRLASEDSLWMAERVRLEDILSVDEKLLNLGTFLFVALQLLSVGRKHSSYVTDHPRLIWSL